MKDRGVQVKFDSILSGKNSVDQQDQIVKGIWSELVEATFKSNDEKLLSALKKKINKL